MEFVRQYAADGWKVIGACRRPESASDLMGVAGDVDVQQMDITDWEQVSKVALNLKDIPIDLLLNNAGIVGPENNSASFGQLDIPSWLEVMRVNTMAPLKVTEAFLDHVKASQHKTVVFISSRAGSIAERGTLAHHQRGGSYVFRSSKAALNAAAKGLAFDLAPSGVEVLVFHPGWVKTDGGGPEADLEIETSISSIMKVIKESTTADSGTFRNYDGSVIPW